MAKAASKKESSKKDFNGVIYEYDKRDYRISKFVPINDMNDLTEFCLDLPQTIDITMDQSWYSACVGFAYSLGLSVINYGKTHKWINFDPFMIYGTRDTGWYHGKGMIPRQAAETVMNEGAFFLRDFGKRAEMPGLEEIVEKFKEDNPELVEKAKDYRIEGYSSIDTCANTVDEIKLALTHKMPVAVCYEVYGSLNSPGKDGYVKYPQTGKYRGDHCMLIVGWTSDDHWIVLNSWGSNHNGSGAVYISFEEPIVEAYALSDTICPIKTKHNKVELTIGSSRYHYKDVTDGVVNEQDCDIDVAPYIKGNRTYIPVRFVAEALGASVEWDASTGTATLRSEEAVIRLKTNSNKIIVNDNEFKMDVKPEIVNNRMMVPVRYIAENLNCTVEWDADNRKAIIQSV